LYVAAAPSVVDAGEHMDFVRTLKRRPKKQLRSRVNVAPRKGGGPKPRKSRRGKTFSLATPFPLALGLAVVTQGLAEDYFICHDPDGKLVISNKKPPPGSKIIRQRDLPDIPQTQEPVKAPPHGQTEGSPKPSKSK